MDSHFVASAIHFCIVQIKCQKFCVTRRGTCHGAVNVFFSFENFRVKFSLDLEWIINNSKLVNRQNNNQKLSY